jgi:septal ring factor EnvC (AmiA/AmiB activator)
MSEITNELMFELLKKIHAGQSRIEHDIKDLKFRMGQVERAIVATQDTLNHHSGRFDRIEDRLERIEKRLDLVDA